MDTPTTNDRQPAQAIEALLFALGRPLSRGELAKALGTDAATLEAGIKALQQAAPGRGLAVVDDGDMLELRVAGDHAALVERVRREEYTRDVGRAGREVLAAVLYRGPLARSEIDFVRGVNSSQTLRTLTVRGLLRRLPHPRDQRQYLYQPTTELLSSLGITHPQELPEYAQVQGKLQELEAAYRTQEVQEPTDNHAS